MTRMMPAQGSGVLGKIGEIAVSALFAGLLGFVIGTSGTKEKVETHDRDIVELKQDVKQLLGIVQQQAVELATLKAKNAGG